MTSMLYFTLLNDPLFSLFYWRQMLFLFAMLTARKTIFSSCKCSENIVFSKKNTGIWSVVLSWKMVFVFPRIWSYSLDGKWKMFFLKKYVEIWYFLYIWYRWYFFFLQYDITPLSIKQRWFSPENVHLKIIFPGKSKKMIFIPENCFFFW